MPDEIAAPPGTPAPAAEPITPVVAPVVAPVAHWADSYSAEDRGWAENRGLLNMTEQQALAVSIKGHQNAEQSLGIPAERRLDVPVDQSVAGAMDEIYTKLGRPDAATDYTFKSAKADGEDKDAVVFMQGALHKAGVSEANADAFYTSMIEWISANQTSEQNEAGIARTAAEHDLQREWGSSHDGAVALAKAAAAKQGVDGEAFEKVAGALGYGETMKLFHGIGKGFGEDTFIGDGGSGGPVTQTPEGAQSEVNDLLKDKVFNQLLDDGDVGARKKWDDLHVIIASGMTT